MQDDEEFSRKYTREELEDALNLDMYRILSNQIDHSALKARIDYLLAVESQLATVTAQRDELFELLEKFFDEYERGTPAYEDPDDLDGYLGNAFVLGEEIFGRICEVLNQHEKSNDKIAGES